MVRDPEPVTGPASLCVDLSRRRPWMEYPKRLKLGLDPAHARLSGAF